MIMETHMRKAMIPVEESFAAWRRDPKYVAAYDALENELTSATAKIRTGGNCHKPPPAR
jgi:hypothetical protein